MAIKSILCHMANDPRHRDRLELAIALTHRFEAHLNVVYVTSPVSMPTGAAGRAASNIFIQEQTEASEEKAAAIRSELEERFSKSECSHEMHMANGDHVKILAEHAHLSDLVIVGQGAPKSSDHVVLHTPEKIALEAGGPVLILPFEAGSWSTEKPLGSKVAVAWKNSKESIRAVRDGLSFLTGADEVHVFTSMAEEQEVVGVDVGQYLSLHGVHAEVHPNIDPQGRVGEQLRSRADTVGADLIVMGAFGSDSTWKERLFGGVTEHMLAHLERPLLVGH